MYDAVVFIDIHYFVLLMHKLHTLHIWFLGYVPVWRCGTLRIVLSSYKIEKGDEDKSNSWEDLLSFYGNECTGY